MTTYRHTLLALCIIVIFCSIRYFYTTVKVAIPDKSHFSTVTTSKREKRDYLRPPFKIVQIGRTRSGSTFQFQLLRAIIALKSPRDTKIHSKFVPKSWSTYPFIDDFNLTSESTFIIKTHGPTKALEKASRHGLVAVFSSSDIVPYSMYTQERANIERCSECEVRKYKAIFKLTDDDIEVLEDYVLDFKILRRW